MGVPPKLGRFPAPCCYTGVPHVSFRDAGCPGAAVHVSVPGAVNPVAGSVAMTLVVPTDNPLNCQFVPSKLQEATAGKENCQVILAAFSPVTGFPPESR
jgi:hypothetical protein